MAGPHHSLGAASSELDSSRLEEGISTAVRPFLGSVRHMGQSVPASWRRGDVDSEVVFYKCAAPEREYALRCPRMSDLLGLAGTLGSPRKARGVAGPRRAAGSPGVGFAAKFPAGARMHHAI